MLPLTNLEVFFFISTKMFFIKMFSYTIDLVINHHQLRDMKPLIKIQRLLSSQFDL